MNQATANRVFEAALTATFRRTRLGLAASVTVGGYAYTVEAGGAFLACIDGRSGRDGHEYAFANATHEQDDALRAAIAAQGGK
ncbi:hypothetical protein [Streptomyces filamentosus]|uniref:hypothetical protein n=1 Tax=Streptomyces filamentosus TaxID=67294 RepID=UPI0033DFEA92